MNKADEKMIVFNCGWMADYDGPAEIYNGGEFVTQEGYGYEAFNFRDTNGRAYGFVQTVRDSQIVLERLGAAPEDEKTEGVLVVFTATHPEKGGTYVCGWFRDATVYRKIHSASQLKAFRTRQNETFGYRCEAEYTNAVLLPEEKRLAFQRVPRGKGGMGESNVWYADSEIGLQFRREVMDKISKYEKEKADFSL